ncbi:unnamed protein product [Leptidea sinapis]|uniref:Uncharacterized protein n=1 Tax=Leptidea sinapis TaxID=189913 RepID=A0A5E4QFW9_9NEOP|nr:unnamed protein product [Leptidea sinapis]
MMTVYLIQERRRRPQKHLRKRQRRRRRCRVMRTAMLRYRGHRPRPLVAPPAPASQCTTSATDLTASTAVYMRS